MNRYEFYSNLQSYKNDHLEHHGILGQKWGIRRYQNEDGSLTEEGKQRYLNSDGSLNDKAPRKLRVAYEKNQWQQRQNDLKSGKAYEDNYVYDDDKQKEKLENAKTKKTYDLDFVETIQNAENLSDDDITKEYESYLKNPYKYMKEFQVDGNGDIQNSLSMQKKETPKTKEEPKSKAKVYMDPDKEIDLDGDGKRMLNTNTVNKWLEELGDKADKMSESDTWKYIAERVDKEMPKVGNKSSSKDEKKEIKAARKEVEKNLKGGIINNWQLLNAAMKEAGITDQKNMSASDWNKVNDIIKDMRKSK